MEKAKINVGKIIIPTYPEPAAEEMPMFAENRNHQGTTGCPYPNKVVTKVDRSRKEDKEYVLVTLENEYVKIEILPEIGGRIYSALDKTTGYDYFYKQHVIKPALIGDLGSWISGGVEFNWPLHHRPSTFMPCDYSVEEYPDGSVACHLSEHDPIDRMKGMVSVILRPSETSFETKVRVYNRNSVEKSFLWWENAAVPVNEDYQIFFPADVNYVNYHYLKSRTTYPVTGNGVFAGVQMEEERDISWHKNSRLATSYFACASEYDFFGGYDHGRECGVVHIGNHHVSPGKKMFTWAYSQLAKLWEDALTDTDGPYAELMAASYSDNQPNFSWLAPYETKEFSHHWYPIKKIGTPTYANLNCGFKIDRDNHCFKLQTTKVYKNAIIQIYDSEQVYYETVCDLEPNKIFEAEIAKLPDYVSVLIVANGDTVAEYKEKNYDKLSMPEEIGPMPVAAEMNDAEELYLAGVHTEQYRDPAVLPDCYWKEALKRNVKHIPSLISMAKYELSRYCVVEAESYIQRAIEALTIFNERTQSGEAYYTYGRILEAKGNYKKAYDYYYKAYWAADSVAKAMTRIAILDIRNNNYKDAVCHAENALDYGRNNNLALACLIIAKKELNEDVEMLIKKQLHKDRLDYFARFLCKKEDFYDLMDSDPLQTCLDIVEDLSVMGRYKDIVDLLEGLERKRPECHRKMLYYAIGYYKSLLGEKPDKYYNLADNAEVGPCFPVRFEEMTILKHVVDTTNAPDAKLLLGCLLYNKLKYTEAAALWEDCKQYSMAKRNLAVAYFSHLNKAEEALMLMKEVLEEKPGDEWLLYEMLILMNKMNIPSKEKIKLAEKYEISRDDVLIEVAKAYNQSFEPKKALDVLINHVFVPAEGGEETLAKQYMFAHLLMGKEEITLGNIEKALTLFKNGQKSLGSYVWNEVLSVPLKYYEACCLEKIGKQQDADEIFRYIANIKIDHYIRNRIQELPYWQTKSLEHLGEPIKARHLMIKCYREWKKMIEVKDNGYYGTTPFYISFVDEPAKLRKAQYFYLMALCNDISGNKEEAMANILESIQYNSDNQYALLFKKYGF